MTREENHARGAFIRSIAMVLVAFLTPVCATLARGGGDWEVSDALRLSWYGWPGGFEGGWGAGLPGGEWIAWPMLAAAAIFVLFRPRASRLTEGLAAVGLIALGVATTILWTGGARLGPLSLRSANPSATLGFVLLGWAIVRGGSSVPNRARAGLHLTAALLVGAALQAMLMHFDASRIDERIANSAPTADARSSGSRRVAPDVLWIVVDTLRADALGSYRDLARPEGDRDDIGEPPRTPFLDRLAARGVVFERVRATAPWTLPSMMSAFTSRWPSTLDPVGRGRSRNADDLIALDPATPTWIEVLREAGYHAAGFQKNPFLGHGSGFETHFDLYRLVGGDRAEAESGGQLVRAILRWADVFSRRRSEGNGSPYLLYVHFMEPHVDYRPPARWRSQSARDYAGSIDGRAEDLHARIESGSRIEPEDRDQLRRLYDSEVAYLDSMIARLVDGLEARGLLDRETLVVLSSDHGEQFAEHGGWEHGDLHVENVHVPLLLAGAGLEPGRVRRLVSALDLGPTILAAAGFESFEAAEGRSRLAETSGAETESTPLAVFSEYGERTRVELDPWILIEGQDGSVVLYDGASDPRETRDLAAERPDLVRALKARIDVHRARDRPAPGANDRTVDRRTIEMLRELGYLHEPPGPVQSSP